MARLAGVGAATVSRVINSDSRVRDVTRERVLEAIRTLNYAPNAAAQQLAGHRLVRLGLAIGNPSRGFTHELMRGALEEAPRLACQLMVSDTVDELLTSGVDGLIIGPFQHGSSEAVATLEAAGLPVVVVNALVPNAVFSTISMEQRQGARELAEHLLGLGHRAFGFVNGDPRIPHGEARRLAFVERLEEAGIAPAEIRVETGDFTFWSGFEAAERMLAAARRPTAIFSANDEMAAGVLAVAHRMGLRVPAELSIVGFDDAPLATEVWPPLTTIRQDTRGMASAALRLLADRLRGREGPWPTHIDWPHRMIVRESASAPLR